METGEMAGICVADAAETGVSGLRAGGFAADPADSGSVFREVDDELLSLFLIELVPGIATDDPCMARELLQCEIMGIAGAEGEEVPEGEVFTDYWLYRVRAERRRRELLSVPREQLRARADAIWRARRLAAEARKRESAAAAPAGADAGKPSLAVAGRSAAEGTAGEGDRQPPERELGLRRAEARPQPTPALPQPVVPPAQPKPAAPRTESAADRIRREMATGSPDFL